MIKKSMNERNNPELEITSQIGCPMMCKLCPQKVFIKKYKEVSSINKLSFNNFKLIIDKLPNNVRIAFAGRSEPFVDRDTTDMILYAYNKGHKITLYTTGVGMTSEDIEKLKDVKFDCFSLHLPDMYEITTIRITDEYIDTIKNIKNANFNNFEVKAFGNTFFPVFYKMFNDELGSYAVVSRAGSIENCSKTYHKGVISCGNYDELNHFSMLPDGRVCLCCMDWKNEHILGNLLINTWDDLFQSNEYKKVCEGLKNESINIACRKCEWSVECDTK